MFCLVLVNLQILKVNLAKMWGKTKTTVLFQSFVSFLAWSNYGAQAKGEPPYLKQAMRKRCAPTWYEPAAYGLLVPCSTSWDSS